MLCGCERAPQAGAEEHQSRSIRVHSWGEYLAPDVLSEFERRTGIEVNVSAYEDTDSLVKILQASPGKFDVVITDDSTVKRLVYMRLLRHLKKAQVPNIERIAAEFLNNDFDPGNAYTMP